MPKMLAINIGFVTNSSSMVYHFPKSLLNDPKVKTFLDAFEVADGFVGEDLWHRGLCATFAVTKEQKQEADAKLNQPGYEDYRPPGIDLSDDTVTVIYGDEHPGMASIICSMLKEAAERAGIKDYGGSEYN